MTYKLKYTTLILSLYATLVACSDRDVLDTPKPINKTPIELNVGGVDSQEPALTRAVVTDGTGKTLRAFTDQTRLFFAMVAEDGSGNKKYGFNYGTAAAVSNPAVNSKSAITFPDNYLYWDDAYARDSKVSVYSIAVANKERGNVALTPSGNIVIGTEGSDAKAMIPFTTTSPGDPTFKWQIANPQTQEIFEWADLVFSNNIADYSSSSGNDNRLKFHTEAGEKYHKFDKGELIYYHALTQFTIKIKCGEGFTGDGTDFKFTNASGVACTTPNNSFGLNGFYGANGVFLVGQGEFQSMTDANLRDYTSIYKVSETHQLAATGDYYVLKAYVFPGTDMTGTKDNAFSFIIDGNKYDVSLASLITALQNGITGGNANVLADILSESKYLKAGYNYEFTFTVGKSKINNITAQVADWESVSADDINPTNARITLNLEERNNNDNSNILSSGDAFSLYRAADNNTGAINDDYTAYNWAKTYSNTGANVLFIAASGTTPAHWKTDWYWDNNKNFYHFRALCEDNGTNKVAAPAITNDNGGDYLTLSHCEKTASTSYKDILWGAPMLDKVQNEDNDASTLTWKYGPTTNGFDKDDNGNVANALPQGTQHQIYKAIGPTENAIKLILFHMMSDVTFKVKTSETTDPDRVNLGNGNTEKTTIELQKIHKEGKLFMGNGLVKGSDTPADFTFTTTPAPDGDGVITWPNYGAIPQSLTNVVLVITTPDHNQYKVAMKDVLATAVTNNNIANPYGTVQSGTNAGKYIIDRWYPGYKYTYTFKLTKKGITDLQATIVDWETVEAGDDNVQIQ